MLQNVVSACMFLFNQAMRQTLYITSQRGWTEITPFRAHCGLHKEEGPVPLHINFADLWASQFIALNALAPQQLLLFCCISRFQLGEVGRRGEEIVVPLQIAQIDEHVQSVGQHQQQDQGHGQADQNGWREGGGTVSGLGKLPPLDGEALDLSGQRAQVTYSFSPKIYLAPVLRVLDS